MNTDTTAIWIPARRNSTRLPTKLLTLINDRPLLAYTLDRAQESAVLLGGDNALIRVVTDCESIAKIAQNAGVKWTIVDEPCSSGTERLARAWISMPKTERPSIVVNLQGDEPLIPPHVVADLARLMWRRPEIPMGTLMRPGHWEPGAVSVVVDRFDQALYFSRQPLPGHHPTASPHNVNTAPAWGTHVGVYSYRGEALGQWLETDPTPLEMIEGLEQLRALEYGMRVAVLRTEHLGPNEDGEQPTTTASERPWFSVDTEQDLKRFEQMTITGAAGA